MSYMGGEKSHRGDDSISILSNELESGSVGLKFN